MPHLEPDRLVLVDFLLDHDKLAGADFIEQSLVNVFLDDTLAQFLAEGPQFLVGITFAGHTNRLPCPRASRENVTVTPCRVTRMR